MKRSNPHTSHLRHGRVNSFFGVSNKHFSFKSDVIPHGVGREYEEINVPSKEQKLTYALSFRQFKLGIGMNIKYDNKNSKKILNS